MEVKNHLWQEDDEQNIRHFTNLVAKYGIDSRSLDWGSRESQQLRFSVLAEIGKLNGTNVLDVGCGLGDFFGWLQQSQINVEYNGIDITPQMVELALERFPNTSFQLRNLLFSEQSKTSHYDFVFASGIFTYRQVAPLKFIEAIVSKMFSLCSKGAAFNFLSAWADRKEPGEFYADPLATVEFCRTLTPWVVLRHDYMPHDFTIYMYKEQQSG